MYKDMSILVYAYILMDCSKNHCFKNQGFWMRDFLLATDEHRLTRTFLALTDTDWFDTN